MIVKQLLLMTRYRFNFVLNLVAQYMVFGLVFFGGKAAASQIDGGATALSETFEGVIVGWFLLTMAQAAYRSLHSDITSESQWGTLEQLYMSPYGFGWIMGLKNVVNVLLAIFWGALMLVVMMITTWTWLSIDLLTITPIVILSIMSILGVGFMVAGLALVYKKVSSINNIIQFVLVGLIAAPASGVSALSALPLVQGSAMLQEAMRNGRALWEFPLVDHALLLVTGLGYFVVGYLVFRYGERVARRRGVMGHY
jgi:ABC-2 type transport system permease protein